MLQNKTEAQVATKSAQDKAERIRNEGFQAAGKNDVDESFLKPMLKDAWGRVIAEQSPKSRSTYVTVHQAFSNILIANELIKTTPYTHTHTHVCVCMCMCVCVCVCVCVWVGVGVGVGVYAP
jgi:hypothetical protein